MDFIAIDFVLAFSLLASHGPELTIVCMHSDMHMGYFKRKFPLQAYALACVCKELRSCFGNCILCNGCRICLKAVEYLMEENVETFFNLETELWSTRFQLGLGDVCRFCLNYHGPESFYGYQCDFCDVQKTCIHCHVRYNMADQHIIEDELNLLASTNTGYLCAGCLTSMDHDITIPDRILARYERQDKFVDMYLKWL